MPQYKMLLVDLYIEFLRRSCERQRFSYYARMGTLMEKYRETRDESLTEDFKSLFEKELKVRAYGILMKSVIRSVMNLSLNQLLMGRILV